MRSPSRSSHTTFVPGRKPVAVAQGLGDRDLSLPIDGGHIGNRLAPVVLPSALQRRRRIATSHDDLPGDSQKSSRNLSARVMAKSASSFAAPRRETSRFSDTDFTSSHFA